MEAQLGNKVKKGMFWTFSERIGTKVVQFTLQIILARILVPEDYGLCALILAFVNIATVFVNSGLGTALIQKKDTDEVDFSSVLYVSLVISIFLYGLLFFLSPEIARFFNDERISLLLRVVSVTLIIGAFNSVQMSVLVRKMKFSSLFIANLSGILISAIVSVSLALNGWGVWAIVLQYMVNRVIVTAALFFLVDWRPQFLFSLKRVKGLFSFGWKCMATSFLSTAVTDIYTAVVGKCYTKAQLGSYDTGNKIPSTVSETFTSSLGSVLFPAFTQLQDNIPALRAYVIKSNKMSSFLMFPLMFGLAAVADPIIRLLLTEKWISAVPFLQMACVLYAFYPLHIANIQAINAMGRSDVALRCEIQKKILDMSLLALMVNFSIYFVALGRVLTSIFSLWINMRPNRRFLNYSLLQQIKDVLRSFIIAIIMSMSLLLLPEFFKVGILPLLLIQILTGILVYVVLSYFFNRVEMLATIQIFYKCKK